MNERPRHWRRSGPPPWWPEGEPWPPHGGRHRWRRRRRAFVGRFALLAAIFLLLSLVGAGTIVSSLTRGRLPVGPFAPAIVFVLVAGAVLALIVRGLARPIGDVVAAANRLAEGDYAARAQAYGPPSVRAVGHAFNTMAGKLQAQDRQRRELMADIAHEIRTPLSVVQGRLEGLLDGVYPRDDGQIAAVLAETRTLARLVDDLRVLSHAESGMLALEREQTDLTVLAHDVAGALEGEASARRVGVRVDAPPDVPLASVDPLRLREVLMNLLSNALRHTPADGTVAVTIRHAAATAAEPGRLTIAVADTGSGIPPEDLPRVFDRFYKSGPSPGSGLGLTIARKLVEAHGGEIRVESRVGHGTTITVTLPIE